MIAKHPERAQDLLAYQNLILKASTECQSENHTSKAWLDYDIMFRRQVAHTTTEKWAQINNTIWNMCFLKAGVYCSTCKSRGHKSEECTAKRFSQQPTPPSPYS